MSRWARFRAVDGRVGFGSIENAQLREYSGDMFDRPQPSGLAFALDTLTLLSPCTPGKIVALWNNFHALAAKIGKQPPPHPLFFIKSSSSVVGSGEAIRRPDNYGGKIVFEGELGVVIGKPCRNVAAENAAQHIFGYTCINDVTAMDILFENPDFPQWSRSKSFDTFGCLGPVICDDLDWAAANVITRLDGVERQNYSLSDMIFSPEELVSRISYDLTLLPGDVIACGTSIGVGSIKDGVSVAIDIEGIGSLVNALASSAG
jgi:2-keto-4-pentenoate hydratase/2-oxohepta-3-ene-1,7-dioic acid hydratase in catechol pathway